MAPKLCEKILSEMAVNQNLTGEEVYRMQNSETVTQLEAQLKGPIEVVLRFFQVILLNHYYFCFVLYSNEKLFVKLLVFLFLLYSNEKLFEL